LLHQEYERVRVREREREHKGMIRDMQKTNIHTYDTHIYGWMDG